MQATMVNQYERMTVHVPRVEAKRFKAIVKALGFEIEKKDIPIMEITKDDCRQQIKEVDKEQAGEMFLTFFCVAHGMASLLANNSMEYDEGQCGKMLENVFFGMTAARKGR